MVNSESVKLSALLPKFTSHRHPPIGVTSKLPADATPLSSGDYASMVPGKTYIVKTDNTHYGDNFYIPMRYIGDFTSGTFKVYEFLSLIGGTQFGTVFSISTREETLKDLVSQNRVFVSDAAPPVGGGKKKRSSAKKISKRNSKKSSKKSSKMTGGGKKSSKKSSKKSLRK